MESEIILKKDGVRLVRKRLNELLKSLGFQKHSTNCFIRAREHFIDEIQLDTAGYHLEPWYHLYYRPAPFTRLHCDMYRLWRTAQMTSPYWSCEIPPEGGPYYYEPEQFEAVWQDVSRALEQYLLPYMEAMTPETFLSLLVTNSQSDLDLFRPQNLVNLKPLYPGWPGTPEAAVYGVGLWRMGRYEEGVPYLTYAQKHYRSYIQLYTQEGETISPHIKQTLRDLNCLMFLWKRQRPDWTSVAQERIDQVAENWASYIF